MEGNSAAPFQISSMGLTHGMETEKSVTKTMRFIDFEAPLTVRITSNSKGPTPPLVIATKSTLQTLSSPLMTHTKKKLENSVMAISHLQGDFIGLRSEDHPPIRFHRMRNPPSLDLLGDFHPHEEVQYHLYGLNAQKIMALCCQNRNPKANSKMKACLFPNRKGKGTVGAQCKGNLCLEHGLIRQQ